MRKLVIPHTYEPNSSDEASELRVVAVTPAGSLDAALQQVLGKELECLDAIVKLGRAQPHLWFVLCELIDALDGLAYHHPSQGLLPLAGEPLWRNLPSVWPDTDGNETPDLAAVAEWLTWFGADAEYWWGGLSVTGGDQSWIFTKHNRYEPSSQGPMSAESAATPRLPMWPA